MKRYINYFLGILRHKWFVFWAYREIGCSFWSGIIHDWTKFLPVEFFAYAYKFRNVNGTAKQFRDTSGAYDPVEDVNFRSAWIHHQRNKHHWQAWVCIGDYGKLKPVPMPRKYVREMVGDWIGAGRSYSGKADPVGWYSKNVHKMVIHTNTKRYIIEELSRLGM